jgi:uncharacterized protein (DUF4415 family)
MMKRSRGSSARGARAAKNEKGLKSKKIDFSDLPELSNRQLSSMRRVGRPTVGDEPRKLIAIRLDAKFWFDCGRPPAEGACRTNR